MFFRTEEIHYPQPLTNVEVDLKSNPRNLHLNNEIPTFVKRQYNVHKNIQAYCLAC